jgi:hypothetical protein
VPRIPAFPTSASRRVHYLSVRRTDPPSAVRDRLTTVCTIDPSPSLPLPSPPPSSPSAPGRPFWPGSSTRSPAAARCSPSPRSSPPDCRP